MDMRMPIMNGYEATQTIKAHLQGQATVIIALTASAFDDEKAMILSAGCDDFMRKPFREEVLLEKIAKYLGVRYIYHETVLPPSEPHENMKLSAKDLASFPRDWISQLHKAARELDTEVCLSLLEQFPSQQDDLRNAIADLVRNYRFDVIMQVTDSRQKCNLTEDCLNLQPGG